MSRGHLHAPRRWGERTADLAVAWLGSWPFLLGQAALIAAWVAFNGLRATAPWHFDNPQLTILNLLLSTQAAIAAPLILLSQRRQAGIAQRRDDHEAGEVEEILARLRALERPG